MSDNRVFFSWQSDTDLKNGRTLIREALKQACEKIRTDTNVDEAARDLSVDSDTKGVPGQPPIVDTIFKKIDTASVYVADFTLVGKRLNGRLMPNPNVLIEYGWALRALGFERIICVMNVAYGKPSDENLPFNLKHVRWPWGFNLPDGADKAEREIEKQKLISFFETSIKDCLKALPAPIEEKPVRFIENQSLNGPGRFRMPGQEIGIEDPFRLANSRKTIYLNDGPSLWLRVFPENSQGRKWEITEIKKYVRENISLFTQLYSTGGAFVLAEDGFGTFSVERGPRNPETDSCQTDSITFMFESCEIWSIDVSLLPSGPGKIFYSTIQESLTIGLNNYITFLRKIGVEGTLKWKAGIIGVKGRFLTYPDRPGYTRYGLDPMCVADLIEEEGPYLEENGALESLLPFFKKIFTKCGVERPDYLNT